MASGTIVCGRCGAENIGGDQFCGACGAFLEWEGQKVTGQGAAEPGFAPMSPDPGVGEAGVGEPPAAAIPVEPVSTPIPTRDPEVAAGVVVCPACRTANPTGRVFCQSCGSKLTSIVVQSPAAAPLEPTGRTRIATGGGDGPRRPSWLPFAALGLVAVVAMAVIVAGTGLFGPAVSSPQVSSAPGTGAAPSGAPTAAPTDAPPRPTEPPTAPPPTDAPSLGLTLTGASASSVVGNRERFAAAMVIDGRLDTCWQEGRANETGEWIEVTFAPSRADAVVIHSGYQLSADAYFANRRPRDVLISVNGGPTVPVRLEDSMDPQTFDLGRVSGATRVRIEIVSTYDPRKTDYPGSPFDDMAISEIRVLGVSGS